MSGHASALGNERLSMDGGVGRLAGLGLRYHRRLVVQLRGRQLHPNPVAHSHRLPGGASGDQALCSLDGLDSTLGLGGGRHLLWLVGRQNRAVPHAATDHRALLGGNGSVRAGAQRGVPDLLPYPGQPGHRRRVGGRRFHGFRGGSRQQTRQRRRFALHLSSLRPGVRRHDQPTGGLLLAARSPGVLLARSLCFRPAAGTGGRSLAYGTERARGFSPGGRSQPEN